MKVSILGYGASPLGGVFDPADPEEGIRAVHYAIDHGVNYFDVAPMYGVTLAEKRLGVALKGKRDKVFLATKCGRYDVDKFDEPAFYDLVKGLNIIALYHGHWHATQHYQWRGPAPAA